MVKKCKISVFALGLTLMVAPSMAKNLVASNCTSCHEADANTIIGTIVPGTQTDTTVEVTTGDSVWKIRYDANSELESFMTTRELRDDKSVSVKFHSEADGWVYAEKMSYKPSYYFHTLDNIITMAEVNQVLQKSPAEGNYMIVDARGYDNYIEGHLPNAELIPYYRLNEYQDRLPKDKNTQIIAYCRGFT